MFRKIANPAIAIVQLANDNRKARRYEKEIAKSQEKIGPYTPTSCPVQIWA